MPRTRRRMRARQLAELERDMRRRAIEEAPRISEVERSMREINKSPKIPFPEFVPYSESKPKNEIPKSSDDAIYFEEED